jgi:hypothetical protein
MKRLQPFLILFLLAGLLTSCSGTSSGPQAWIDQPLDGSQFPLEPLNITAHAADNDGVASFDFFLNGIQVQSLAGQGSRLSEVSWLWVPTQAGEFILSVVAVDSQGNLGPEAQTFLTITAEELVPDAAGAAFTAVECLEGQEVALSVEISSPLGIESYRIWNLSLAAEISESFQDPLPTSLVKTVQIIEPAPDPVDQDHQWGLEVVVPGQAEPLTTFTLEPEGRCPGHYQVAPAEEPVPEDQITAIKDLACRRGPDSRFEPVVYLLQGNTARALGKLADGTWIQVQAEGDFAPCWTAASLLEMPPGLLEDLSPVAPPPLPEVAADPATDTPQPDTSSPVISGLTVNPTLILTQSGGCAAYSRTTTVQVTVTDNSSVSTVTGSWSVAGESGQITLSPSGGSIYSGTIGPVNTTGTLAITIQASDGAGNSSSAAAPPVTVQNCIE